MLKPHAPGQLHPAIRFAESSDAGLLTALMERTFRDTYAALTTAQEMELHVSMAFSEVRQRAEIEQPGMRTILVETGGEAIAFAQVRRDPAHTPVCVRGPEPVELWRIYVDRQWHGYGIAQRLMAAVRTQASNMGGQTLWLGVWERNPRAMAFYCKCGFVIVGDHIFQFGKDAATDLVMSCAMSELIIPG